MDETLVEMLDEIKKMIERLECYDRYKFRKTYHKDKKGKRLILPEQLAMIGHDAGKCLYCNIPLEAHGEGFVTEYCPKCRLIYYAGIS